MKKMILVSMSIIMLLSSGFAQEKEKNSGQFGLYFENSAISWFPLSGITLNFGKNAGKNFRIELAGTYFPLLGECGGDTVIGFSLSGLVKVTNHPRLNILIGPGFKMLGILSAWGESIWTPSILFKGMAEYRIDNNWGMRAVFNQNIMFPSYYSEVYCTYMTSSVEWGFFWQF
jgi:hypothetical protein